MRISFVRYTFDPPPITPALFAQLREHPDRVRTTLRTAERPRARDTARRAVGLAGCVVLWAVGAGTAVPDWMILVVGLPTFYFTVSWTLAVLAYIPYRLDRDFWWRGLLRNARRYERFTDFYLKATGQPYPRTVVAAPAAERPAPPAAPPPVSR